MLFTLTNQQHYSTAPGSLKTFFSFKNQQHYLTASGFQSFYNHSPDFQLEIFSLSDHKPSALPHSFWFFFLLREFLPRGFRYKLYFILKPSALPYSFWFFLEKFSLSNTNHQHYHTASGFPKHFITNHRHCHTASGFP